MRVYKFRSKKWGIKALEDRQLKVSPIYGLNDPFEYLAINLADKPVREFIRSKRKFLNANSGLISFCKRWSNPVIWSHYAEDHQGMALGFDVPDELLFKMEYSDQRVPFDASSLDDEAALQAILERVGKTKFKHWEYEEEYRLLFDLTRARSESPSDSNFLQPFAENLALKEVVLGCRYESSGKSLLESTLTELGIIIKTARPAFCTFTMTEQKCPTLQMKL